MLVCIDPGPKKSGCVVMDGMNIVKSYPSIKNNRLRELIRHCYGFDDHLVVEMVASMGMSVKQEVFDTAFEAGRFVQAWRSTYDLLFRREVKMHMCGTMRAKDNNIRAAILDRYEPSGGGKEPRIGVKKQPGPLYGVARDAWAALALGITWIETHKKAA